MGASFAVALAQSVTRAILASERLPTLSSLRDCVGIHLGPDGISLPYIDDVNTVATRQRTDNRSTKRLSARLSRYGLPVADDKTIWWDGLTPVTAYGLEWCPSGLISPRPDTVRRLVEETVRMLRVGAATQKEMKRLIGL